MTPEEIREEASRRIRLLPEKEYEARAAQIRADLELTEKKNITLLTGKERQKYLAASMRLDARPEQYIGYHSLQEYLDRYGYLSENQINGQAPRKRKTWIFVLLCFASLIAALTVAAIAGTEKFSGTLNAIAIILFLLLAIAHLVFGILALISLIRNLRMKSRLKKSAGAAITEDAIKAEMQRQMTESERIRREALAPKTGGQAVSSTASVRVNNPADFNGLADDKFPSIEEKSGEDDATMVRDKFPIYEPVQSVPKLTESAVNDMLRKINADNTEVYVSDIETENDPALGKKLFKGIEETAAQRVSEMTQEEYDAIATPIRELYGTLLRMEKEGFGRGPEQQNNLRLYEVTSYRAEKMIQDLETKNILQPILIRYGLTESDLYRSTPNLLKDLIRKYALILGGSLVLLASAIWFAVKMDSHFTDFEGILSFAVIAVSGFWTIKFFVRTLTTVIHNAKLNRMIEISSSQEYIDLEIEKEVKKVIYLKEKERYIERYNANKA